MRDEILPAKDVAVYWIEHVLRHGGTQHLQLSSKKLTFVQKHLIDVIMFLEGVFLLFVILMILGLRWLVKYLFKKAIKQKVQWISTRHQDDIQRVGRVQWRLEMNVDGLLAQNIKLTRCVLFYLIDQWNS